MSQVTNNLGLKKAEYTDIPDIGFVNDDMDLLDALFPIISVRNDKLQVSGISSVSGNTVARNAYTISPDDEYVNVAVDFDAANGSDEELAAYEAAKLYRSPADSKILFICGTVPTIDIPIVVYSFKAWGVLAITSQPKDITAAAEESIEASITATGSGLTYQWQYKESSSSTDWVDFDEITSATTATLSTTMVSTWDGRIIRCKVTDDREISIVSETATITLKSS